MTRTEKPLTPRAVFWPAWGGALAAVVLAFLWAVITFEGHGNPQPVLTGTIFIGLAAAFMGLMYVLSRRCLIAAGRFKGAQVRYLHRLLPAMMAYVILFFISSTAFNKSDPQGLFALILAVAPALPLMAAVWAMALYVIEEEDEVERAIQTQSFVWGTGAALVLMTVWGFLDQFDLVGHAELWIAFPLIAVCIGLAQPFVRRRYR